MLCTLKKSMCCNFPFMSKCCQHLYAAFNTKKVKLLLCSAIIVFDLISVIVYLCLHHQYSNDKKNSNYFDKEKFELY